MTWKKPGIPEFGADGAILLTFKSCPLCKNLLESQTATPVLQGKELLFQTWADTICESSVFRAVLITPSSGYKMRCSDRAKWSCDEPGGERQISVRCEKMPEPSVG